MGARRTRRALVALAVTSGLAGPALPGARAEQVTPPAAVVVEAEYRRDGRFGGCVLDITSLRGRMRVGDTTETIEHGSGRLSNLCIHHLAGTITGSGPSGTFVWRCDSGAPVPVPNTDWGPSARPSFRCTTDGHDGSFRLAFTLIATGEETYDEDTSWQIRPYSGIATVEPELTPSLTPPMNAVPPPVQQSAYASFGPAGFVRVVRATGDTSYIVRSRQGTCETTTRIGTGQWKVAPDLSSAVLRAGTSCGPLRVTWNTAEQPRTLGCHGCDPAVAYGVVRGGTATSPQLGTTNPDDPDQYAYVFTGVGEY